tara:strand:- start:348 stop:659 length:312 start_codon:yes stop_codon:yes gene_type:complete
MRFSKSRKVKKEVKQETYYDDISDTTRSMVVWLDDLLRKPEDLVKLHRHQIHTMQIRAETKTPFHKNKTIDTWIRNKINSVVHTYLQNEAYEEQKQDLKRYQR